MLTDSPQRHTPQWVSLVAGGVAGGVEAAVTVRPASSFPEFQDLNTSYSQYPFEYSKTRVQLLQKSADVGSNPFRLIFNVARQEGIGALYTGCSTLVLVGFNRP